MALARERRGGFSLIELLVVIFIIIVIVAITIPALSAARKAARKVETQTQLSVLSNAVDAFEKDQNRAPGYFTPREMGDPGNVARGFTSMQNILLDLAGGVVPGTTPASSTVRDVGPTAANVVRIDTNLIGTATGSGKLYLSISRKNFITQDGTQGDRQGVAEHVYPELVDSFGTPVLAWAADETARQGIDAMNDFVRVDASAGPARFYWASNTAFLTGGKSVGKRGINNSGLSMLGDGVSNQTERMRSLMGLLGNPGSSVNVTDSSVAINDVLPSAPRGTVVFHSAGEDGAFLPKTQQGSPVVKDPGTGQCTQGPAAAILDFGLNFRDSSNAPLTNSIDLPGKFNDIIKASGS